VAESSTQHREAQLAITAKIVAFHKRHVHTSDMGGAGAGAAAGAHVDPLGFLDQFTGFVISELGIPGLEIDMAATGAPKVAAGSEPKAHVRAGAADVPRAPAAKSSSSSAFKLSSAHGAGAWATGCEDGSGRDHSKRAQATKASDDRSSDTGGSAPTEACPLLRMRRDELYDFVESAVQSVLLQDAPPAPGAAPPEPSADKAASDGEPPCVDTDCPKTEGVRTVKGNDDRRPHLLQRVGPGSTFVAALTPPSDLSCASTFVRALSASSQDQSSLLELVGSLLLYLPTEQLLPSVIKHVVGQLLAEAQSQRAVLGLLGGMPHESGCRAAVVERTILALPDATRLSILQRVRARPPMRRPSSWLVLMS
jgi:hypothetical protein